MVNKKDYKAISLLNPNIIKKLNGLPNKAICGYFINDNFLPENFIQNQEFVDLLHKIISLKGHLNYTIY